MSGRGQWRWRWRHTGGRFQGRVRSAAAAGSKEAAGRWAAILTVQRKRLEALQKTLADYAHNSTADRRHLITPEQKEAGAASIRLFAGTPDRDRTR